MAEETVVTEISEVPIEAPALGETKEGDQVEKGESATPPGDTPAEQPPKKKGGGFQKRIDRLTRQVYEQATQIETLRGQKPAADDKEPKRDDFEDLEGFHRALAEHTAKRVIREQNQVHERQQREVSARQEQEKRSQSWDSHVEKASDKYEDGSDAIENFMAEVTLHPFALDAIIESDLGGDIAVFLGKNEKEAARIGKLTPARQAIEIGKLEVKLASAPVKKASSAPAPITPVGNSGSSSKKPLGEQEYDDFVKSRKARIAQRR